MVSPAAVILYRTRWCGFCVRAERLLTDKGVDFEQIDVTGDSQRRSWLLEVTGQGTVPQIFIDQQPIGGYDELSQLERGGKLDALLRLDAVLKHDPSGS